MTPVIIVGMVAGGILILTAVVVFLSKKEFSTGGVGVAIVGFVLIGMSQWSSIKITVAGATIETIVRETAVATDEVAAEVDSAASAVNAIKQQLESLTGLLVTKQVLTAVAVSPIHAQLSAVSRVDRSKLAAARAKLNNVIKKL